MRARGEDVVGGDAAIVDREEDTRDGEVDTRGRNVETRRRNVDVREGIVDTRWRNADVRDPKWSALAEKRVRLIAVAAGRSLRRNPVGGTPHPGEVS